MSDQSDSVKFAVEVRDVSKRYGRTLALDGVSFNVGENQLFALLGPNGAGKTTLLHILCTIHPPDGGHATVAGFDVVRQPLKARQNIGVVFQESSLDTRLTVFENLEFHGMIYGVPRALRRKRIDELLELVELGDWRESLAKTLSSGMKRRLEIARALVHDSRILFLDEPTVGLDAQSRGRLWEYIHQARQDRELTVIVTTHYIEEVDTCDRVSIIDGGRVLALDSPAALKARYGQEIVRVVLRNDEIRAEVASRFADDLLQMNGEIVMRSSGDEFVQRFLSTYGAHVASFAVERPTLESVFLSLTGREIRDQAAGAREQTYAFGKSGGEHTR